VSADDLIGRIMSYSERFRRAFAEAYSECHATFEAEARRQDSSC
jgi:hypothetical protein